MSNFLAEDTPYSAQTAALVERLVIINRLSEKRPDPVSEVPFAMAAVLSGLVSHMLGANPDMGEVVGTYLDAQIEQMDRFLTYEEPKKESNE